MHIFWIAGLLLALIDFPDFSTPLNRIAGSTEKIANIGERTGMAKAPSKSVAPPQSIQRGAHSAFVEYDKSAIT
jgi:hypothetical protein